MTTDYKFFDPQILLEKLDQDDELAVELLNAFIEDAPSRLDQLVAALDGGDVQGASEAAHSLKGMCGVVRVQPLVNLALSMEVSGQRGDGDKVQSYMEKFKPLLESVINEVTAYLQSK